jgi:membrane-bound serine protease (ClpP class)
VLESRAFTDTEAAAGEPALIDLVAPDLQTLLRELDGRTVRRFDGRTTTLRTRDIALRHVEMTSRQKFLGAIAHPQIAYLLLTLGMLGLTIELWNPGGIVPGVLGGLSLLLAFFAFQILPVNTIGVLLVVFGLGLLVLELKVPSFGMLGIGGVASLLLGSIMITREIPGVRVSLAMLVPVALATAAIVLVLGRLALAAQRQPPATGVESMVGIGGRTRTRVAPDAAGQVDVRGEIWRAISPVPLEADAPVRVTRIEGLTLVFEPAGPPLTVPPDPSAHGAAALPDARLR